MKVITITNPVAGENTYLLETEKASLLVDPGSNGKRIIDQIKKLNKPLAAILLTLSLIHI